MRSFFYVGYPLSDIGAPHQAMAALYLARQGHRVIFFAWGNAKSPIWLSEYRSLEYRLIAKKGLLSAFRYLSYLFKCFWQQRSDIDIFYVQGAQQTPFLFWLPWIKGKCKTVYHTQDYLEPGLYSFYEKFERFFARRADWVISNEPNRARFMASSYQLKQVPQVIRTTLPSWWNIPEHNEEYRQQLLKKAGLDRSKEPRLVVAGGTYRRDRMGPELLNAFAKLPANYGLVFSGMEHGNICRNECEKEIQALGLERRVLFLEPLNFFDLLQLYTCCDIGMLLYPNSGIGHFYQAPGRLTEYLRCGLPIVTANFPGLELLVLKYDLGEVANPYQSKEIANAIHELGKLSNQIFSRKRENLSKIAMKSFVYEIDADSFFAKMISLD